MADKAKVEATNEFCFIYSTYPHTEAAMLAAKLAIEHKLAACVNIHPPMKSLYMWEGKREEQSEVAVFFKTRRTLVDKAVAELWLVHNYSVPCFIVLPIEGGNSDYLAWARAQTEPKVTV